MRAGTARRWLIGVFGFLIVALGLQAIAGDDEARSTLGQVVVLALLVGGLAFLTERFRIAPRRAAFGDRSAAQRLRAMPGDPTGFLSSGFEVVRWQATGRDVESTAVGRWHGHDVTVVDYWYARSSDPQINDYVRLVCAVFPAPERWPRLLVIPERIMTLVGDALLWLDPGTESEAFNRRFALRTDDRRFASAVLDARMLEWLLSLPDDTGFEILGGRLLCFAARNDLAGDVESALATAEAFLSRVPGAARSIYG